MASAARIGTRGSPLPHRQSEWVGGRLRRHHPDRDVALVEINSQGGRDQNSPLAVNGGIAKRVEVGVVAVDSSKRTLSAELKGLSVEDSQGSMARDYGDHDSEEPSPLLRRRE